MARDTIAFVEAVPAAPVDLVGCSDGATVALLVAWLRPDLVKRLVSSAASSTTGAGSRAQSSSTRRPTRSWATGTARSRPTAASTGRS
jgi:pimeloyl-ACP methyl ester carboxylesterase